MPAANLPLPSSPPRALMSPGGTPQRYLLHPRSNFSFIREAIFASSAERFCSHVERLKAFCKGLLRLSRGVLGSLKVFGCPTRIGAPRGSLGALPRGVFAAPSKPLGAFIKAFFAPVKTFLSLSLSVFWRQNFVHKF